MGLPFNKPPNYYNIYPELEKKKTLLAVSKNSRTRCIERRSALFVSNLKNQSKLNILYLQSRKQLYKNEMVI